MSNDEIRLCLDNLRVAHCCRDWPVFPLSRMGRCGYCGETPEMNDKTIAEYQAERDAR